MREYFAKLKYLFKWRDLAFTGLIFAIILVFAFCEGARMMQVTFGPEAVDVVTDRYTLNIPYEMVDRLEIADYDTDDDVIDGKDNMALRCGLWKNESWGEYYACIDRQTDTCILVHLKDGRLFVFSHESDENVRTEYNTFLEHLNQ